MDRTLRFVLFVASIIQLIAGIGFAFQVPAFTQLWPIRYTGGLSFIFIGSIFCAAAGAQLWCLYVRENGAFAGIALDYLCIFIPLAIFCLQIANGNRMLQTAAVTYIIGAIFGAVILIWSLRFPITDPRPQPKLVRYSFVFFIVALLFVGGSLVLKNNGILPWPISVNGGVIYGWMFIGAAAYFTYSLIRPSWINTGGQLAGFLAYDLVLILPFLLRLPTLPSEAPQYFAGQLLYTAVIVYSGLLATYYLFINPTTRMFGAKEPVSQPVSAAT